MSHRTLRAPEILVRHDAMVGEGPVWDPRIGRLIWVDIPNKTLFTTDPPDGTTQRRLLPKAVGVVLPRASGGYVAALEDGFHAIPDRASLSSSASWRRTPRDSLQRRRRGRPR